MICSRSSGHPQISSFVLCFCSAPLSSRNCTTSSSSSSESPALSLGSSASSSGSPPCATSISQGDQPGDGGISGLGAHESRGEGGTERCGSRDGAFDCARDGTVDGALDGTLDATLDKAGVERPNLDAEHDDQGEDLVNMNWVSFV